MAAVVGMVVQIDCPFVAGTENLRIVEEFVVGFPVPSVVVETLRMGMGFAQVEQRGCFGGFDC